MSGISDTERLVMFERSLLERQIAVDQLGRLRCPLKMWHIRGSHLNIRVKPQTTGNYIPVQCKWCKASFHIAIQRNEDNRQIATIQSADISRLSEEHRAKLLTSLKTSYSG